MENKFNFNINGLPENQEFEVPDSPNINQKSFTPSPKDIAREMKSLSGQDFNRLKKDVPQELISMFESMGVDIDQVFSQVENMVNSMDERSLEALLTAAENSENMSYSMHDDECENDDSEVLTFNAADKKYLEAEDFGSLECYTSQNLYDEFINKYGTDSEKYLDDNVGIHSFILNDLTSTLNIDSIKNMRYINSNNYYILFYMEPKNTDEYGYFAVVLKTDEDEFSIYIPTYCNTFNVSDDGISHFNKKEIPEFFYDPDSQDVGNFKFLNSKIIEFAVRFVLSPKKKVLLAPRDFGEIKNIRSAFKDPTQFIPIGRITSNESVNSILLIKDAELSLEQKTYTIYMKVPDVMNPGELNFIAEKLFDVNFNDPDNILMKNVELEYTNDKKLFFRADHLGDL